MEAGINPVKTSVTNDLGFTIQKLGTILDTVCSISKHSFCSHELNIIQQINTIIWSHTNSLLLTYNQNTHPLTNNPTIQSSAYRDLLNTLQNLYTNLWRQLQYPHPEHTRSTILNFLIILEQFLNNPANLPSDSNPTNPTYNTPKRPSKPSYWQQISNRSSPTIDPYQLALTKNFYYPLIQETISFDMEDDNDQMVDQQPHHSSPPSPKKTTITIEDSIETIFDMVNEIEEDDPPTQPQLTQDNDIALQQISQTKPSSYTHRFSIYKRNGLSIVNYKPTTQLTLFKSFCKCLKSIDPQIQLLPIRNDRNIHALSTTDQINNIEDNGILSYFKAYKKTKRTLSGDFNISSKLPFNEISTHKNLSTWFHLNGYNITLSGCQTSDMVKIGFLTRVRCFTYRDDMQSFISQTEDWKANPFHFRLYFDSLTTNTKGAITYVMMNDVDRPNIERAISFLQNMFDGDSQTSPNKIPYIFFPLYRKTYTDEERLSIIQDNDHHTEQASVVAMHGLHDLNTVIHLTQGIHSTIHHLLLAIPCQGTSNGTLFNQVERQANNDWQLCCFNSMDTTKVSIRLGTLESILKRCIHPNDHNKAFRDPNKTLRFTGQVAPLKKGRPRLPILTVDDSTLEYTSRALKKLHTITPKRQAVEIEQSEDQSIARNEPTIPSQVHLTNLSDITNPHPDLPTHIHKQPEPTNKFNQFEKDLANQNNRLTRLEDIYDWGSKNVTFYAYRYHKLFIITASPDHKNR
jgi:hypothetical protein